MFCAACGHVLKEAENFCDQCGARAGQSPPPAPSWSSPPLTTAPIPESSPPPAPVYRAAPAPAPAPARPPAPVPQPPAAPTAWVAVGLLLFFLLAGGVLAVVFLPGWLKGPGPIAASPSPTETPRATPTETPTETPRATPTAVAQVSQAGLPPLEAFTGGWTTREPGADEIVFRLEEGTLVADIPSEKAQVRLSRLNPGDAVLHGSYSQENGDSIPMTGELSADGQRLTLTLAPPQSEFERVELVRSKIEGIEPLDLSDPLTYLPGMDFQLTYDANYPDGDSGTLRAVSTQLDPGVPRSQLVEATSRLYPGEPSRRVCTYRPAADGLHRVEDGSDEIWLPARLSAGARWTTQGWECRIKSMDAPLDLGFEQFHCLVVERSNQAVQVSETIWLAPGYGEVLVREGGQDARRLTAVELLDPREAERQVRTAK